MDRTVFMHGYDGKGLGRKIRLPSKSVRCHCRYQSTFYGGLILFRPIFCSICDSLLAFPQAALKSCCSIKPKLCHSYRFKTKRSLSGTTSCLIFSPFGTPFLNSSFYSIMPLIGSKNPFKTSLI